MKHLLILAALLSSSSAMAQQGGTRGGACADSAYVGDHRYECDRAGQDARERFEMNSRRAFYIPDHWWVDMDQRELACDRYPDEDKWMRERCIAKMRGGR